MQGDLHADWLTLSWPMHGKWQLVIHNHSNANPLAATMTGQLLLWVAGGRNSHQYVDERCAIVLHSDLACHLCDSERGVVGMRTISVDVLL